MRRIWIALTAGLLIGAGPAGTATAQPLALPMPVPRPLMADPPLPPPRPVESAPGPADASGEAAVARIYQAACPAVLAGLVQAEALPPIAAMECGEFSPLRLSGIQAGGHGIALPAAPTVNCRMAAALADWVAEIDQYAQAELGAGIAELRTGPAYQCRRRNNAADGPVSEHGFANAVDVSGFVLTDGRLIAVAADWAGDGPERPEARLLAHAQASACARFTTVLGPDANPLHADHLHLDLGCHGQSCRLQLCE